MVKNKSMIRLICIILFLNILIFICILLYKGIVQINHPSTEEYPIIGVDVSSYQGDINWKILCQQNISFAYIKATEGSSYIDRKYYENYSNAIQTDLFVGAYHFFSFESTGEAQAANFCNVVEKTNLLLPSVIDVELYGDNKVDTIDTIEIRKNIRDMVDILEANYGVKPILYVDSVSYENIIKGYFDDCDLWYRSVYSAIPDSIEWTFWQYSNRHRLKGYSGNEEYIDMNVYNGSEDKFKMFIDEGKNNL